MKNAIEKEAGFATTKKKLFCICSSSSTVVNASEWVSERWRKGNENGSRRKSLLYKFSCKLVLFTNMMKTFWALQNAHRWEGFTILMSRSWLDLIKKFFQLTLFSFCFTFSSCTNRQPDVAVWFIYYPHHMHINKIFPFIDSKNSFFHSLLQLSYFSKKSNFNGKLRLSIISLYLVYAMHAQMLKVERGEMNTMVK